MEGLHQWFALGPLFHFMIYELNADTKEMKPWLMLFANDIVLIDEGYGWMLSSNCVEKKLEDEVLKISKTKIEYMNVVSMELMDPN